MPDLSRTYCGPPPDAATWATSWNLDPFLIALLALASALVLRLTGARRRSGAAAIAVLAVAFVSPLCALSSALFAARSVHHLLLIAVAAPLLAHSVPARGRWSVPAAFAIGTATLWLWHLPSAYDAALGNVAIYWVMQATLLASAWRFWATILAIPPVSALGGIAASAGQMGLLGALLTFAPRPLYAAHWTTTLPFGIGPLADQQLAGLIMWVPGLLPYAAVAAIVGARRWRSAMQPA